MSERSKGFYILFLHKLAGELYLLPVNCAKMHSTTLRWCLFGIL